MDFDVFKKTLIHYIENDKVDDALDLLQLNKKKYLYSETLRNEYSVLMSRYRRIFRNSSMGIANDSVEMNRFVLDLLQFLDRVGKNEEVVQSINFAPVKSSFDSTNKIEFAVKVGASGFVVLSIGLALTGTIGIGVLIGVIAVVVGVLAISLFN